MHARTENSELIRATFGKYLVMSILITLSATLGMMIDNVIAGNLLGSDAVAAIGMSLSVFMLFSGCAGIIETGAVALYARALGNRDAQQVNVLFSMSLFVALSAACVAGAEGLAAALGAESGALRDDTAAYLSGICTGAFAIVMLQLLMGFTRLDNAPQLGMAAVRAFLLCVSLDLINQLFVNYYQATGNVRKASAIAVGQSGFFAVLFALGAVWFWGATAVWQSFVVGEAVTLALQLVVACVLWARRRSKRANVGTVYGGPAFGKETILDKMMYLPDTFQADWRTSATLSCKPTTEGIAACSKQVATWCEQHEVDDRRACLASLAIEEVAGNAVAHGFAKTKHPAIDVKLILKRDGTLVLRLRDNGTAFNPMDLDLSTVDECSAVGIRMLCQGVRSVEYQNTVGLNNVVVTLPSA